MNRTICFLMGVCVSVGTVSAGEKKGGELTDPLEILKKADAATKAVNAVQIDITLEGEGAMAARVGSVKASYIARRTEHGAAKYWMSTAEVKRPGSSEVKKIKGGTDGEDFYVIDYATKKAYLDMDPSVMGRTGQALRRAMMNEFLHDAPFTDEIDAPKKELKGSVVIAGEDCYEVLVVYSTERPQSSTWCFSKKDFLPRRRIQHRSGPDGQTGAIVTTITKLVVDPKIGPDTFKFKLPDGFEQIDDFAP